MKTGRRYIYFLHGLESSGNGTKGRFFADHFPEIKRPDFTGNLAARLTQLEKLCDGNREITFVGSSFGGLMASCFAESNRTKVSRMILMAPALNFENYVSPALPIEIPTLIIIGQHDNITPMVPVLDIAHDTFNNLTVWISDDDHMLHNIFTQLDWVKMLDTDVDFASLQAPFGVQTNNM